MVIRGSQDPCFPKARAWPHPSQRPPKRMPFFIIFFDAFFNRFFSSWLDFAPQLASQSPPKSTKNRRPCQCLSCVPLGIRFSLKICSNVNKAEGRRRHFRLGIITIYTLSTCWRSSQNPIRFAFQKLPFCVPKSSKNRCQDGSERVSKPALNFEAILEGVRVRK